MQFIEPKKPKFNIASHDMAQIERRIEEEFEKIRRAA